MYVAKCSENLGKLHNYELSPHFITIQECQKYIDMNLQVIEYLLSSAFSKILWGNHFENGKEKYTFSFGGSMIRVYDLKQKRFIDSFDL